MKLLALILSFSLFASAALGVPYPVTLTWQDESDNETGFRIYTRIISRDRGWTHWIEVDNAVYLWDMDTGWWWMAEWTLPSVLRLSDSKWLMASELFRPTFQPFMDTAPNVVRISHTPLVNVGDRVQYCITAYNNAGESARSNIAEITVQ
jgi:hypothetical protein